MSEAIIVWIGRAVVVKTRYWIRIGHSLIFVGWIHNWPSLVSRMISSISAPARWS